MSNFDFVAIDFETATPSRDSACSIGLVAVKNCEIVDYYTSLVRPPKNIYNDINVNVHNITPDMTESCCCLCDLWYEFAYFFDSGTPVVAHNVSFDMSVLKNSGHHIDFPNFVYVDTMSLPELFGIKKKKLIEVFTAFGFDKNMYNHHEALSDAYMCAHIMASAMAALKCKSVFEMLVRYPKIKRGFFAEL